MENFSDTSNEYSYQSYDVKGGVVLPLEVPLRNARLFTLSRHHLLERAPRNRALDVVGDILGLNAQGALNVQLSLWNRVDDLDNGFIPQALHVDRTLVKTWVMRDTVHVVPTAQLPLIRRALEPSLMMEWNRWTVKTGTKQSAASWEPMYNDVLDALGGGSLTIKQLMEALAWSGRESLRILSRLMREMSLRGLVCHAESSGPWYHNTENTFASVDKWLPDIDIASVPEEEALSNLAKRYLASYGPASVRDFAYWTGMGMREARPVFNSMADSLVEVTVPEQKGTLLIQESDASELLDAADRQVQVRLLPQFDALIMGHKDKTRFIEPKTMSRVFLPRGDVAATILVDGRVHGVWNMKKEKKIWRLELSPIEKLSEEGVEEVESVVEGLRSFTGFDIELDWNEG